MPAPADPTAAPQPFLRWAGGKRRLLPQLLAAAPARFERYFEPFLGGGAAFFGLADRVAGHRCVLGDVNAPLMTTYRVLRDDPDGLIARLDEIAVALDEAEFLAVRAWQPTTATDEAARVVYLNRTCFNGLWRENAAGKFNVPYGHLKRPQVCDEPRLRAASARLQGAALRCEGFEAVCERAERGAAAAGEGDFVYLDPPYVPASPTASFASYAAAGFGEREQDHLAGLVRRLSARGCRVLLSNSDTPLTRAIYQRVFPTGGLHPIHAPRAIAANGSRAGAAEILAASYPPAEMADPGALGLVGPAAA